MFASFDDVRYQPGADAYEGHIERAQREPEFARWLGRNVEGHRVPGYNAVYVSLKRPGIPPGDVFTAEFYALADLMDKYNQGFISTVYNQNLLFQYIRNEDLEPLYDALSALGMARANMKTISDVICCPGLDYCALANASSIPVATALMDRFQDLDELYELGDIQIKMSGCINACGHHHVGHIGILGINKRGEEFYQIAIGGSAGSTEDDQASVGEILGAAVAKDQVVDAVERLVDCYVAHRQGVETFLQVVRRVGIQPFKEHLYATERNDSQQGSGSGALHASA
jgi:sulfite reductase (NADPH) hemoprotein beta-component